MTRPTYTPLPGILTPTVLSRLQGSRNMAYSTLENLRAAKRLTLADPIAPRRLRDLNYLITATFALWTHLHTLVSHLEHSQEQEP